MIPNAPGRVTVKAGVSFTTIAPAGFRLLAAIERTARTLGIVVVITSACDGAHSGPADPHHRGCAYDLRTHGLTPPQTAALLEGILGDCRDADEGAALPVAGIPHSLATARFFGFLERPNTDDAHLHIQLRQGRGYPA